MHKSNFLLLELLLLFMVFPISLFFDYPIWIKLILGLVGFIFVVYYLLKVEKNTLKISSQIDWKEFWKVTLVKFLIIALLTTLYVWFTNRSDLFVVLRNKPVLWLIILFVYSLLSVYPQEILYRTFFFQRYRSLFKNEKLFILLNALVFSMGHLFFKNGLVLVLTFFGGLLFAMTYAKTKSTVLVSIEHAIYGSWLFTVGMGSMLGFPD
ncbi:MAG: CPBP family intramembrane metalloprotease [Flavobacteriaceae bacterium]|nr:CPBP family intramembrane metalloprotease [Flavobacteriaceae bacterium]